MSLFASRAESLATETAPAVLARAAALAAEDGYTPASGIPNLREAVATSLVAGV